MARVGDVWTSPQEEGWETGVTEKNHSQRVNYSALEGVHELLLHFCEPAQIIPCHHPIAHESPPQA